jgi:hypothetical protein
MEGGQMQTSTRDASALARRIVEALACGQRGCRCESAVPRGHGLTHASWRTDSTPSLHVDVKDGKLLVHDFGGGDGREETIAELRRLGLWPEPMVRVARIPRPYKDVAELLGASGGRERYERMIAGATPAIAWMVDQRPAPGSPRFGQLGRALARLDQVERTAYVRLLAQRLDTPAPAIDRALTDYLDSRRSGRSAVSARSFVRVEEARYG